MLILMSSGLLCCQVNVCFTWLKGGVPPVLELKNVLNYFVFHTGGKTQRLFFLSHKRITVQRIALACHIKGMNNGYPEDE